MYILPRKGEACTYFQEKVKHVENSKKSHYQHFNLNGKSPRETNKTYMTSSPSKELLSNMFHYGWDARFHDKHGEQIECWVLDTETNVIYFIQVSSMAIYVCISGQWNWIPLEQDDDGTHSPIILVDVLKNRKCFRSLTLEENWTLFDVRQQLELEDVNDFRIFHNEKKVRKCREDVARIMP